MRDPHARGHGSPDHKGARVDVRSSPIPPLGPPRFWKEREESKIDVFQFADTDSPELSLLSDEFLDSTAHSNQSSLQLGPFCASCLTTSPTLTHP